MGGGEDVKLRVADRWPVIYNWAHGGSVLAPELGRELHDVLAYLGFRDANLREALRDAVESWEAEYGGNYEPPYWVIRARAVLGEA